MSEKNKNGNDRLSDFIRYLENKLTDRERNAFERNLQKDPFAEEASEGMEGIDPESAEKDISELRIRMKTRTAGRKRILLYRIAASVAVLMILSTVFIITDKREEHEQLVYSPAEQQTVEIQILKEKPITEALEYAALPDEDKQKAPASPKRIIDTPARTVEAESRPDRKTGTKEDQTGNEKIEAVIPADAARPDQVVATRKAITAKPVMAKDAGNEAEEAPEKYTPPRPVNGRADFDKYILDNIKRPDTTTTGQRVVVVLNFNVNPDGKIDSIKVISSPGKKFSDEAIRLIMKGPAWQPAEKNGKATSDEVRIRIVFK